MKIKSEIFEDDHVSDHIDWNTNHWSSGGISSLKTTNNHLNNVKQVEKHKPQTNEYINDLFQKLENSVKETNRLVEQIKKNLL